MLRCVILWMVGKDYSISPGENRHGKAREMAESKKELRLSHMAHPGAVLQCPLQKGDCAKSRDGMSAGSLFCLQEPTFIHFFNCWGR